MLPWISNFIRLFCIDGQFPFTTLKTAPSLPFSPLLPLSFPQAKSWESSMPNSQYLVCLTCSWSSPPYKPVFLNLSFHCSCTQDFTWWWKLGASQQVAKIRASACFLKSWRSVTLGRAEHRHKERGACIFIFLSSQSFSQPFSALFNRAFHYAKKC